jgi:hypothetical protein
MRYAGRALPGLVVATVGLAACSDSPSSPGGAAPAPVPQLAKAAPAQPTHPAGATFVSGNLSGEGNAVCSDVAVNPGGKPWSGQKFDPPVNSTVAGYKFTLSGDGKYLTFAPTGAPTTLAILAVVVKGGPNTYVYTNPAAGTQMQSPVSGGGNVPGISHYVVCFGQASTTITATKSATGSRKPIYEWTLEKKIDGIWDEDALGHMIPYGTVAPDRQSGSLYLGGFHINPKTGLPDPLLPDIKWVEYRLTATRKFAPSSGGVSGSVCVTNNGSLATQGLKIVDQVQYSVGGGPFQNAGAATQISVGANPVLDPGESHCYPYELPAPSVDGATYRNTATVTITNHAGAIGSDHGPTVNASFTLPSTPSGGPAVNETAVVTEDMVAECNTLYFTHGIGCAMPEPHHPMPGLGADHKETWTISGPTWTTHFFVDLVNFKMICTGERTLTNVATLKPSDGALITSNPVVIRITRAPCL